MYSFDVRVSAVISTGPDEGDGKTLPGGGKTLNISAKLSVYMNDFRWIRDHT